MFTTRLRSNISISRGFARRLSTHPPPPKSTPPPSGTTPGFFGSVKFGRFYIPKPVLLISPVVAGLGITYYLVEHINARKIREGTLASDAFTTSYIVSTEPCGPDTKLITLQFPPLPKHVKREETEFPAIWSVSIRDSDMEVERAYTPLDGMDQWGRMKFYVKKYADGEVGRWLHWRKVGEPIGVRGPLRTWDWKDGEWDEVVMVSQVFGLLTTSLLDYFSKVSGGTGITPFCQLFNKVIDKVEFTDKTKFTLLHSSKTPEDLPPPPMLDPMIYYAKQHPERFSLHLFVDNPSSAPPSENASPEAAVRRISKTDLSEVVDGKATWTSSFKKSTTPSREGRKILFLVCGPNQYVICSNGSYTCLTLKFPQND
jgi:cytochrome-b5 reductase